MYVQTAGTGGTTDATPNASDGIFVYGGSTLANLPAGLAIGDSVQVTGTVSEFNGSTQISPASASDVVELGSPLAPVTGLEIAYPTTEETREAQEGMLLAPTDTFTVTNNFSTNNFGEVGLATGDVPLKQPTEFAAPGDTAGIDAIVADNAERAVILDDAATTNYLQNQTTKAIPLPWLTAANGDPVASPPRVGAEATLVSPVILAKAFNAWRFQPRQQVTGDATYPGSNVATFEDTRTPNLTPQDVGGDISIATFNVLNFFNTTGEAYEAAGPLQNPPLDTDCTLLHRPAEQPDRQQLLWRPRTWTTRTRPANESRTPTTAAARVVPRPHASLARQEQKLVHTINTLDASVVALEEMENSIKLPGETNRDEALAYLTSLLNDGRTRASGSTSRAPARPPTPVPSPSRT